MADFDLATGVVKFKGDVSQFEEDLKQSKVKLQDLNKGLQTGGLKMQLYAAKSFNHELKEANRQAKRLMDEVRFGGKTGAFFNNASQGLNTFSQNAGRFGAGALGVAGGALALGSQGSPLAESTFSGSLKLLKTEVGGVFTPLVKEVSKALQDMSKGVRDLTPAVKDAISEGAKFVGIAGMVAIGIAGVTKGMSLLAAELAKMKMGGPGGGGGSTILSNLKWAVGIGAGWSINEKWSEAEDKHVNQIQSRNMNLKMSDVANDREMKSLRSMNPEAAKLAATWQFTRSQKIYEEKQKEYEEFRTGFMGGNVVGGLKRIADTFTGNEYAKSIRQQAGSAQEDFEKAKLRYSAITGNKLPKRPGEKDDMLFGAAGPATMVGGVAEMLKNFQVGAASGNQLEAEVRKAELKNQEELLKNSRISVTLLESINRNLPLGR